MAGEASLKGKTRESPRASEPKSARRTSDSAVSSLRSDLLLLAGILALGVSVRYLIFRGVSIPASAQRVVSSEDGSFEGFVEATAREEAGFSPFKSGVYAQLPPVYRLLKAVTGCHGSCWERKDFAEGGKLRLFWFLCGVDALTALFLSASASLLRLQQRGTTSLSCQHSDGPVLDDLSANQTQRVARLDAKWEFISPPLAAALFYLHPFAVSAKAREQEKPEAFFLKKCI